MSLATPEQAGSHYPATSDSKVRGLEVPMPSYARQVSTAPLLDRVEETRRHVLTLLDNANESVSEAMKSATNQACTGQLTENWRSQRPDASNADIHLDMDTRSLTSGHGSPVGEEASIAPDYSWATLEDLALRVEYGTSLRASTEMSDIEVMRMGNIQDGEIVRDDLRYLPSGSVPPRFSLSRGICYSTGPTVVLTWSERRPYSGVALPQRLPLILSGFGSIRSWSAPIGLPRGSIHLWEGLGP